MEYRLSANLRNALDDDIIQAGEKIRVDLAKFSRDIYSYPNSVISGLSITTGSSSLSISSGLSLISGVLCQTTGASSVSFSSSSSGVYNIYAIINRYSYGSVKSENTYGVFSRVQSTKEYNTTKTDSLSFYSTTGTVPSSGVTIGIVTWNGTTFTSNSGAIAVSNIYNLISGATSANGTIYTQSGVLMANLLSSSGTVTGNISSLSGTQNTRINTLSGQIQALSGVVSGKYETYTTGFASGQATGVAVNQQLTSFSINASGGFCIVDLDVRCHSSFTNGSQISYNIRDNGTVVASGSSCGNGTVSSTPGTLDIGDMLTYFFTTNTTIDFRVDIPSATPDTINWKAKYLLIKNV